MANSIEYQKLMKHVKETSPFMANLPFIDLEVYAESQKDENMMKVVKGKMTFEEYKKQLKPELHEILREKLRAQLDPKEAQRIENLAMEMFIKLISK